MNNYEGLRAGEYGDIPVFVSLLAKNYLSELTASECIVTMQSQLFLSVIGICKKYSTKNIPNRQF
jgi:hypothetical protein